MTIDQVRKLNQQRLGEEEGLKRKNKVKLSIDEEWAIENLVKKYKEDFANM
jgi:hypothetical protein